LILDFVINILSCHSSPAKACMHTISFFKQRLWLVLVKPTAIKVGLTWGCKKNRFLNPTGCVFWLNPGFAKTPHLHRFWDFYGFSVIRM